MDTNLIGIVLDEISLEGLEGITLPSLWIRLGDVSFSLDPTDEDVREYLWSKLILPRAGSKDVQFFRLPEPRATIQLYNRYNYVNPDTGACIENGEVPEDVYGIVAPINDGLVRGSCNTFETRTDVTKAILDKSLSLKSVMSKYDRKLVIVASQRHRDFSLRIPCFDPCLPLTPMQYCVLEKVGRARKYGEVTVGKEASKYRESPKTLFYYRKILLRRGLIKKQQHIISMRQTGQNRIGLVLTLPRFHFIRLMPLAIAAVKTNDLLLKEPDQTCDFYELQEKVGIKKKLYKAMFSNYTKNFSVHEFHEETPTGRKTIRRQVKLLKVFEPDAESDEDNGDGEEEGEDNDNEIVGYSLKKIRNFAMFAKAFDPKRIRVDRPLATQTLEIIDHCKSADGISLRELGEELRLPKLEIRQLSRVLERSNEVTTQMTDHGKQKIKKYQSIHRIEDTRKAFADEELSRKFGTNETLTFLKRANIIMEAVRKNKIYDELVSFKKLISAAEKDSPFTIDRKSVRRIINKLALNGYVRYIKTKLTCQDKEQKLEIICDPSIKSNSSLVRDRIETNKFRFFGTSGDESYANRVVKKKRTQTIKPAASTSTAVAPGLTNKRVTELNENGDSEFKYKPSIAKRYGYEPKMRKLMTLYKFLFHVMCAKPGTYRDWRQHIPKAILNGQGWCTLGDIIPRIPLSVFVKIVFVNYVISELEDYLNDPDRCNLTLSMLPAEFRRKLLFKRKYIFNIFEELVSLSHMGLIKVEYTDACPKETAKVTIITTTSFKDCDNTVKTYNFTNLNDVEQFNSDLSFHCSRNDCTNCSLDPRLFAHNQRNWTYAPSIRSSFNHTGNDKPASFLKCKLANIDRNQKDNQDRLESLRLKCSRRKRSAPSTNPVESEPSNTNEEVPTKRSKTSSANRLTTTIEEVPPKKRVRAKKVKRRTILHDDTDIKAIKLMKKRRVQWSKEEDSFLLMCRIASILLDPTCPTFVCVHGSLIRDELHKYLPEISMDKTIKACQRRLNYMLKKNRTRENVLEWVSDVKQEIDALNIGRPTTPKTDTAGWHEAFLKHLHVLLTKFQAYHLSLSSASNSHLTQTYETLDQLKANHKIIESHTSILPFKPDLYKEPENVVEMAVSVIQNVITSTLMFNIHEENPSSAETSYSHTLFKIYQCYPDVLIRSVIVRLSKNRIMTKVRKYADALSTTNSLKTRGLAPYKISQAYLFRLKTKYCMDTLTIPLEGPNPLVSVESGSRVQALLISHLFAAKRIQFSITIPDNFVFVDKGKLESRPHRADNVPLPLTQPAASVEETPTEASTETKSVEKPAESTSLPEIEMTSEFIEIPGTSQIGESMRSYLDDPRLASRFALYCFREKLFDDTFINKQHSQDYLAIKSCPVTCTSGDISLNLKPFSKLFALQQAKKRDKKPTDESDLRKEWDHLVEYIKSFGELGATDEQIAAYCNQEWPTEAITHLTTTGEIFAVGVMKYRLVHYDHVNPWLVQSVDSRENQEPTSSANSPKIVRYVPKLWKDAYGNVHKKILFHYLSFMLGTLLQKPGISQEKLFAEVSEVMPPFQAFELIRLLQSLECVEQITMKEPRFASLFDDEEDEEIGGQSEINSSGLLGDQRQSRYKNTIYYKATSLAFINLCQAKAHFQVQI